MEHFLYSKEVSCPICKNAFSVKKVRSRGMKVVKRHEDFYVEYKEINPIYYHVWVCPTCGYSATEGEYDTLNPEQKKRFDDAIRSKWNERDLCGIRTIDEAEESYKLALLTGQLLGKSQGYLGGLCLKLAWIYREKQHPREMEFLKHALDCFEKAYQYERFPIASLDEVSLAYLIGEISRRLGSYKEAIGWYSRALEHPEIKKKRQIQLKAREQWAQAKEQYDLERREGSIG